MAQRSSLFDEHGATHVHGAQQVSAHLPPCWGCSDSSTRLSLRKYTVLRYYYDILFYKIHVMFLLHLYTLQTSLVISIANFPKIGSKYIVWNWLLTLILASVYNVLFIGISGLVMMNLKRKIKTLYGRHSKVLWI